MCRSIKTLRQAPQADPPVTERATPEDVHAAALQYVRKIAGMRKPAAVNVDAFDEAVEKVAAATQELLDRLVIRGAEPARKAG